jgi:hypothetical protein
MSSLSGALHQSSPSVTVYSRPSTLWPSRTMYGDHDPKFWTRMVFASGAWM